MSQFQRISSCVHLDMNKLILSLFSFLDQPLPSHLQKKQFFKSSSNKKHILHIYIQYQTVLLVSLVCLAKIHIFFSVSLNDCLIWCYYSDDLVVSSKIIPYLRILEMAMRRKVVMVVVVRPKRVDGRLFQYLLQYLATFIKSWK